MFPDGPYGPPMMIKKGVLLMSMETGVPIIPITFDFSDAHISRAKSWDRKVVVKAFSTVRLKLGKPIYVSKETIDQDMRMLEQALGADIHHRSTH